MFIQKLKIFSLALAGVASAALMTSTVHAEDFSGKRIEWIIPFKEGGGSDRWARFFAPLLTEALPGNPIVVVKNVPGGGSTKGANQFTQHAKPDGLQILGTSGSTQFPYLLGDKRVNYDYKDWSVVLASATGGVLYVSPDMGVSSAKDIDKLRFKDLKFGSQGATSLDLIPLLSMKLLDIEVKAVFGMKGRGAGRLAFERGEVNLDYQTSSAYITKSIPLVDEGKAIPLMAWGALDDDGNVIRDPNFPDLPSFPEVYEMVHGEKPSGEAWDAWKAFFISGFVGQKMVLLPKGTPQDIIDTYNAAFNKIVTAPDFVEKSNLILGTYPQATGKKAKTVKELATTVTEPAQNYVRSWLTDAYNVKF